MPRSINELHPDEKTTIALATIHLELAGDSDASKTVAKDFDVSPRGVTVLRNSALEAIKTYFSGESSTPATSGIASQELKARLRLLIGSGKANPSNESNSETESPSPEEKEEPTKLEPLDLDEVFNAIVEYNRSEEGQFKIYPSSAILSHVSNQDKKFADAWAKENKDKTKALIEEFNLNVRTNVSIPKDIDLREELGLED
ncbi:MAG: hypothetical protein KME13_18590 [Myxacorys californica WJT36-NPBG1]|jgi:hypothetical protein|nr:hypothetical protein [Myxacorys californica WJT36-NPBG1]